MPGITTDKLCNNEECAEFYEHTGKFVCTSCEHGIQQLPDFSKSQPVASVLLCISPQNHRYKSYFQKACVRISLDRRFAYPSYLVCPHEYSNSKYKVIFVFNLCFGFEVTTHPCPLNIVYCCSGTVCYVSEVN